jgi:hypothetical protein
MESGQMGRMSPVDLPCLATDLPDVQRYESRSPSGSNVGGKLSSGPLIRRLSKLLCIMVNMYSHGTRPSYVTR